jgi:ABC-type transport system involved in multi-copper enzyme maturation permease subunit
MTLLPIVERELRVAARRKSTYRIRFWTAVAAMMGFGWLMLFVGVMGAARYAAHILFGTLTSCAFGLCLLAGILLTADCLSVEKREGTLGLLFLTDLKGYDVVLGKFAALSLIPIYGLLAIFPIMALPLLMGGVTGGEFWRMTLALANALFFSLAAGILFSALCRQARLAAGGTFVLLIFLAGGLPALAGFTSLFGHSPRWSHFFRVSPTGPFWDAREVVYLGGPQRFWHSLLASHMLGWLFVALASLVLPHCWQERPKVARRTDGPHQEPSARISGPARRARSPAQWLEINPVLWFIGKDRFLSIAAWFIVLVWGAVVVAEILFMPESGAAIFGSFFVSRPFAFLLKVLFASETCRFFANARRNGALEMLLCTPLSGPEILQGQRLALQRTFLIPVALFFGLSFLPPVAGFFAMTTAAKLDTGFTVWPLMLIGRGIADFFAVYFFGTALALTSKKPQMAAPLTILLVLILPSFFCLMDFLADLLFISWGASKLQQNFRWLVAQEYQRAPANPLPRVMTSSSPAPPVISR